MNSFSDNNRLPDQHFSLVKTLSTVANAVFVTDEAGSIIWVNDAFCTLSGYAASEAIGHTPALLQSGMQSPSFYTRLWETILAGHVWQGEVVDRRKDGSFYTVEEVITPLFNEDGLVVNFIAIQRDISKRKKDREIDHYLAYHDALTGLPNRLFFLSVLQLAVAHAERAQQMLATLFIDLDEFASINERLGSRIGDRLLAAVADRLRSTLRKEDTLARFGGDAFTVLMIDIHDREVAMTMASALLEALSHSFIIEGQKIELGASIGVSIYPADGNDAKSLLSRADQAMNAVKREGGNAFRFCHTP
ncbi:sensor domain-containing diguanylate cyclase [Noviherbaspirillum sp.]|jgi:diguanylate cyclase (GGDEF)-like protein/PAS domain S-box-containing protein|uniref:sensor domain-containing diguanylate cyclase n=1 Tax=Noviherbaspirillum sp. TaxID=1926288 RepID=UPI0025F568B3|nr:sensor domain-containing diguanylate cyclase [Noviherbaspirillum sp.]